ncbi:AAA family ATPase [Candidatus Woesearchaeota archaeon]|nr:AAA family ATPase [Candidatus Woesearchaeota archaeon]
MHGLIAIVGMPGAGKSTATEVFEKEGYRKIRFGAVTMDELERRGLDINEENESVVRETLRVEHGMDAYAKLNEPKIRDTLSSSDVVIDGLYSWQEYTYLKPKFPGLVLLAIYASPATRYRRLAFRGERRLSEEQARSRDIAEIENIDKASPIAMADYAIVNEGTIDEFRARAQQMARVLRVVWR